MNSPGFRPRSNKPAAPAEKKGSPQKLRVLSTENAAGTVAPSIAMPRAKTELTELLAGDTLLCVRRRPSTSTSRTSTDSVSAASGPEAQPQAESLPADGELACVINAWPALPRNARAAILAMIRETAANDV